MTSYIDRWENLDVQVPKELSIYMVLNSLSGLYQQYIINYNMNNLDKTLMELHNMLKTTESSMTKTHGSSSTAPVLAIVHGDAINKKISHHKGKIKPNAGQSTQGFKRKVDFEMAPTSDQNESICFYYQQKRH